MRRQAVALADFLGCRRFAEHLPDSLEANTSSPSLARSKCWIRLKGGRGRSLLCRRVGLPRLIIAVRRQRKRTPARHRVLPLGRQSRSSSVSRGGICGLRLSCVTLSSQHRMACLPSRSSPPAPRHYIPKWYLSGLFMNTAFHFLKAAGPCLLRQIWESLVDRGSCYFPKSLVLWALDHVVAWRAAVERRLPVRHVPVQLRLGRRFWEMRCDPGARS